MFMLSLCSDMSNLESIFEYIRQKLKIHVHLKILSRDEAFTRLFFFFFFLLILRWIFISVFLTGFWLMGLSLFITFRANVPISIIPYPCSFFFALHLEWSLNISIDKKSNAISISANLCSTLFSLWFKFSSACFYFLSKCTKEREIVMLCYVMLCILSFDLVYT